MALGEFDDLEADAFSKVATALVAEVNLSVFIQVAQAKITEVFVFTSRCRAKYYDTYARALESSSDLQYAEEVALKTLEDDLEEIVRMESEIEEIYSELIERAKFLTTAIDDCNDALEAWQPD